MNDGTHFRAPSFLLHFGDGDSHAPKESSCAIAAIADCLGAGRRSPMKAAAAVAIYGFLAFAASRLDAQIHGPYFGSGPYWDAQYQQYLHYQNYLQWQQYLDHLRSVDPYYDLHVVHYQLYLAPYQPYYNYVPCCYAPGFRSWSGSRWFPYRQRGFSHHGRARK